MMITEHFDEYGPLTPGVRRTLLHNSTTLKFELSATLEALSPESWRVEVNLFGETLIALKRRFPSKQAAGNAAEAALRKHLVRILRK